MSATDRRSFLKMVMGTPALAALPAGLARALEIPANARTRSIRDVEHIVILMQENRSFDHYLGTLRGVRGFADPRAVMLKSGRSVFSQPSDSGDILPFRPTNNVGNTYLPDPPHGWNDSHAAFNAGGYDQWVPAKGGPTTMTYQNRHDIPYHYALADVFTVCDAYYCSVIGPTDPNRYHMWTGWVGNDGNNGGPVITNAEAGYDWSTYPERLDRAGISWKVYQDIGHGLTLEQFWGWTGDDAFIGNYGDNSLLYFHQYWPVGTALAAGAKTGTNINALGRNPARLFDVFRDDVANGNLPQVSWIVAPEAYTEHPNWPANLGAWYMSQFLDILTSNPDVWSKTVLFITYDEGGGFFDHMIPPYPPETAAQGRSTVATTNEIYTAGGGHPSGPYGLGTRVPMIVASPWSLGGFVNSQVFDHTSLIRFLEARFAAGVPDLIETNITPWRRAVAGDLTSAFNFDDPDAWKKIVLPSTSAYMPSNPPPTDRFPDATIVPPSTPSMPGQERGVRPARALPYNLDVHGALHGSSFQLDFLNTGAAAAVLHVRSADPSQPPRSYTVGTGAALLDAWNLGTGGRYDLSVYG